jgi:hypothetical protein
MRRMRFAPAVLLLAVAGAHAQTPVPKYDLLLR